MIRRFPRAAVAFALSSVMFLAVLSAVATAGAQVAPGSPPPGQATAGYVIGEFKSFLKAVRDTQVPYARATGKPSRDDACFRAMASFDPTPQAEAVRGHLVATLDADDLAEYDAFVSTPEFRQYQAHIADFQAVLASGDGDAVEKYMTDPKNRPTEAVLALMTSPQLKALRELAHDEDVRSMLRTALVASSPEGCAGNRESDTVETNDAR